MKTTWIIITILLAIDIPLLLKEEKPQNISIIKPVEHHKVDSQIEKS